MGKLKEKDFGFMMKPFRGINIEKLVQNATKEHQRDILDLQKEQMSAGIADKGDEIEPGYTPETIRRKKLKGQDYDRVTLKDTGAFQRNIYAKFDSQGFDLNSRSTKTAKLVDKYFGRQGGTIFGLTDSNKEYLGKLITGLLQDNLRSALKI